MLSSWGRRIAAWLGREWAHGPGRRARSHRRIDQRRRSAVFSQLEVLEPRQLLTSLVAVNVSGNSIGLTELRGGATSAEVDFSVSYTSSQVVLTGQSGTSFKVGGQTLSTDTLNITAPASIKLQLNQHANDVTISGDGTDSLASLVLRLGTGQQNNSITLDSVITDSLTVHGERTNDTVTLDQSTVNGNLNANLRHASGDTLELDSTTVNGNVSDQVGQLTLNQSTITGTLHDVELGNDRALASTDSTYGGDASIRMGANGVVNLLSSGSGSNQFQSAVTITGVPHHVTTVNQNSDSVVFDVTPTYRHATVNNSTPSNPTLGTPTVNSQTITTNVAPLITGTYDAVNTMTLTVTANGNTYTLGTSSQLTSHSKGQWSLNLGGATLTAPVTTVSVQSVDKQGNMTSGSGTITDGTGVIDNYLTANKLTATTTADGLNYVIETPGTGPVPTKGQTVTVTYSGFLLNSNATRGTEFDSNTISFVLGAGQVIPGWDEAFALLPVGTVAELVIPSTLAYGTTGHGTSVPPNSILIFDVTVVSAL